MTDFALPERIRPGDRHVGRRVLRTENRSLLIGEGEFVDDLPVGPGTLHAAFLRSPHPHAEVLSIDCSEALKMPGMHAVVLIGVEWFRMNVLAEIAAKAAWSGIQWRSVLLLQASGPGEEDPMSFLQWLVVSMLLAPGFPAGADSGCPAPGAGDGDVSHQQIPASSETSDEDEYDEEDEEPDCG